MTTTSAQYNQGFLDMIMERDECNILPQDLSKLNSNYSLLFKCNVGDNIKKA